MFYSRWPQLVRHPLWSHRKRIGGKDIYFADNKNWNISKHFKAVFSFSHRRRYLFNQFSKTICTIMKHNELLHQAEYMKFSDVTCRVPDNAIEPACNNLLAEIFHFNTLLKPSPCSCPATLYIFARGINSIINVRKISYPESPTKISRHHASYIVVFVAV